MTSAYLVLSIQSHLDSHWPHSFQVFPEVRPSSAALHIWKKVSLLTFAFHFHALEKEMATHSSVLAWKIPGMAEPGGLLSDRVGHD